MKFYLGTQMLAVVFVFPVLCSLVGWLYMPVFHNLKLISSYEYLELRFNHSVRIMCSSVYTVSMMLYLSIVVYTPALALETVVGLDVDVSCACIFLVCVFYTSVSSLIVLHSFSTTLSINWRAKAKVRKVGKYLCDYFVILPTHHSHCLKGI